MADRRRLLSEKGSLTPLSQQPRRTCRGSRDGSEKTASRQPFGIVSYRSLDRLRRTPLRSPSLRRARVIPLLSFVARKPLMGL
jgi:hypothetical protein